MNESPKAEHSLRFGVFEVDLEAGELRKQGRRVSLQEQPFRVLAMLLKHQGRVVTREELREQLWPADTFVDFDKSLNTAISKLRDALGDTAGSPRFIGTLPKRGYRFLARVEGLSEANSVDSPHSQIGRTRGRIWTAAALAAAALTVVLAGYWLRVAFQREPSSVAEPAIAVLPFADLSPERDQEYFCDGFVAELISGLTKLEGLRVLARDTTLALKGKAQDLRAVGARIGVNTVLTGSIRKAGVKLRITASLVNVRDGSYLWAQTYERPIEDVFAIQEEVSRAIVNTLRVKLARAPNLPLVRRYTENTEAHVLYLKGRHFWIKATRDDLKRAAACFEQAIALDPQYALAFSGLADTYFLMGNFGFLRPLVSIPKAKEAALRALEIDETLGQAHTVLGNIRSMHEWDWIGAERAYKRGLELSPGDSAAHWFYGHYLSQLGRLDEAVTEMQRAEDLDPLSAATAAKVGIPFVLKGQHKLAIERFRKALELDRGLWHVHSWLAQAYLAISRFDEAISAQKDAIAISGRMPTLLAVLAQAYAVSGQKAYARRLIEESLEEQRHYDGGNGLVEIAFAYADLGEKDRAFECLEKAYQDRLASLVWLKVRPRSDSLRSDPRFAALLKKINLQ